jgi:signal transduction histidine kinase
MTYSRVADGALTGLVLRIFARVYGTAGIVVTLLVMGHARLVPDAAAQVVGMAGGALLAVACVAWGMASVPDSSTRRDLLRWFLVGHAVFLFAMFAWQLGGAAADYWWWNVLFFFAVGLLWYTAFPSRFADQWRMSPKASDWTTLFRSRNVPLAHLRTAYEQKIREAAGLEERHRLARDLHDSIKQQVFVIQTAAATAQARFDDDRDGARSALEEIRAAGREAMAEMETMLDQLRSAALENTGLVEALKRHCEALGFRTGAEVSFEVGALPPCGAATGTRRFCRG